MEEIKQIERCKSGDLIEYKNKLYRVLGYSYAKDRSTEIYSIIPAYPKFRFIFIRKIKVIPKE